MKFTTIIIVAIFFSNLILTKNCYAEESNNNSNSTNLEIQELLNSIKPLPKNSSSMLNNLHKLLTKASLSKEIQKSDDQLVLQEYQQAINYFNLAVAASQKEDVNRNLNRARISMFKAAQLATPKSFSQNKLKTDFGRKKSSIDALLGAFKRIGEEKGQKALSSTIQHIKDIEKNAQSIGDQGDWQQANIALNEAYLLVKTSVQNLRQGDVLIKSLNFASKEEEYLYELDRNETHFMLLTLLVKRKPNQSNYTKNKIAEFTQKADEFTAQANQQAENSKFIEAISSLEQSTKQLVRAIRTGGVFIPG